MSPTAPSAAPPPPDARVRRTRESLGDALVALIHEKPFSAIKVQNVLDRAEVARSTFYAHYRDRDDLFRSDVADFFSLFCAHLERGDDAGDRLAPVRELCAHVGDEAHAFVAALAATDKLDEAMAVGREIVTGTIERRLATLPRGRLVAPGVRPAVSQALAGALFALLTWWLESGMPASPAQMDELFHRLAWSGVGAPAAAWREP
ncbi:MAG TPA: TetR/AcrR family transcriptional regulator [Thermoanaerobaculia bacterium]|nr:TetR/AcrR family transcriptional regulator [Thermoanaerobaculia bacterium]